MKSGRKKGNRRRNSYACLSVLNILQRIEERALKKRGKKKKGGWKPGNSTFPILIVETLAKPFPSLPFMPKQTRETSIKGSRRVAIRAFTKRLRFNILCFPGAFQQIMSWIAFPVITETLAKFSVSSLLMEEVYAQANA